MSHRPSLANRILHLYDLDARQSFAALSRKIGPSRDAVRQIINGFEENGTIRGYITVIDIGKLGYTAYAVFARLNTTDPAKERRLLAYLHKHPDIYWVAMLGGKYDILFAVQAKSVAHFSEVMGDIQRRFPFVSDSQFAIRTKATQFQRAYLADRPSKRAYNGFEATPAVVQLTHKERAVLQLLVDNPRMSAVDISVKLGISRITVRAIIKRLEDSTVIQGFSALISCGTLGYEGHLLLITLKRYDKATRTAIQAFAAEEPSVIFCIQTIGGWHAEFHCEVKSQRELQELARRLRTRFPAEIAGFEIIPALEYYIKYRLAV